MDIIKISQRVTVYCSLDLLRSIELALLAHLFDGNIYYHRLFVNKEEHLNC